MRLYHGTTKRAALAIQREGLNPHRESAFQIETGDGTLMSEWDGPIPKIFVTPSRERAENYAQFRTNYEMTGNGELVYVENIDIPPMRKVAASCNCQADPALVVFDVPQELAHKMQRDRQDIGTYHCTCFVPAKYVTEVISLSLLPTASQAIAAQAMQENQFARDLLGILRERWNNE